MKYKETLILPKDNPWTKNSYNILDSIFKFDQVERFHIYFEDGIKLNFNIYTLGNSYIGILEPHHSTSLSEATLSGIPTALTSTYVRKNYNTDNFYELEVKVEE